jgi:flavin reductase (DIM6/NTAB) family NADH-FMN oxidoreductase RutF
MDKNNTKIPDSKAHQLISPRPVVLITTVDKDGLINAAPFSFIMPISIKPPIIGFAVTKTKHTYLNIVETKEFVVNVVNSTIVEKAVKCEKRLKRGENELEFAGLSWTKSETVQPPRVTDAGGWLECNLIDTWELGDHNLIVGRVKLAEIPSNLWDGNLIPENLDYISHFTGNKFLQTTSAAIKFIQRKR